MKSSNPFEDHSDSANEDGGVANGHVAPVQDDMDPLEAYMDNLQDVPTSHVVSEHVGEVESEFEEEESPVEMMERILRKSRSPGGQSEGVASTSKRQIDSLPVIDHSSMNYPEFRRNLYVEHEGIACLSADEQAELRKSMNISVSGRDVPACICSFGHLHLPESVLSVLRFLEFTSPTPIQSQAIPCLLSGRDVMGIATTGSGKTMAFLIPAIVHVLSNDWQEFPRVLIVCPTRELAVQIEQEAYRFSKKSPQSGRFSTVVLTGGLSKFEQLKELRKGASLIVGNPGRILDMVQMKKGLVLSHVSYCVLDEADRMFNMGFEPQIRLLLSQIRPDRQLGLFSATMPPRIERLCREVLSDPVRIIVGELGQITTTVDQKVHAVADDESKFIWLEIQMPLFMCDPETQRVLIFVNSKAMIDSVLMRLNKIFSNSPIKCRGISSDLDQATRLEVMAEFKSGVCPVLVATDIAARGLHIDDVSCVIEFEVSHDFNLRVHRIGRTGRAGKHGKSWTLLGNNDAKMAAHIAESFEVVGTEISKELFDLAIKHAPFRAAHILKNEQHEKDPEWDGYKHHFEKKQKLIDGEQIVEEE